MSTKEPRAHANERMRTSFANSGRIAGAGISYDRYDEESGGKVYDTGSVRVILPSDNLTQEELAALNGEVRVYKGGPNEQT